MTKELPKRRPTRLKNFDYNENGSYFVTICTETHKEFLSSVKAEENKMPEVKLSEIGKIVEEEINEIQKRYERVTVERYVIMPNHVHLIIFIDGFNLKETEKLPTLSDIICSFKSLSARKIKKNFSIQKVWQRSFYDHIIRNEKDYSVRCNYIEKNPFNWAIGKKIIDY